MPLLKNRAKEIDAAVDRVSDTPGDGPISAEDVGAVPSTAKGDPGGVASLDADGKVPVEQLPYTYGTEDLTAGVSPLETGKLHFVYE